jgi:Na+-driven multidrug efflux pump
MAAKVRYRVFYRLIDICFGLQIFFLADEIREAFGGKPLNLGIINIPIATLAVLCVLIPAFLIFAKFMRDEFAETLWKKTSETVVRALILLPIPVVFLLGVADGIRGSSLIQVVSKAKTLSDAGLHGVIMAVVLIWFITPIIFTFAFQWHRWRAGK